MSSTTTTTSITSTFPSTLTTVLPSTDLHEYYTKQGVIHITNLLSSSEVSTIRDAFTSQVETDPSIGHNNNVPSSDPLALYPRFVHPHRHTDLSVSKLALKYMFNPRILT
jgi:phytanoyl-CoA hydroxylase